jgi:hypothetical protein
MAEGVENPKIAAATEKEVAKKADTKKIIRYVVIVLIVAAVAYFAWKYFK